jgi:haloalkane dehalogenase
MRALTRGLFGLIAILLSHAAPAAAAPPRADALRTPDARFENLSGYNFKPHYVDIDGYRVHYIDEGKRNASPVLMMHGEPTWAYLYRKMIPVVASSGHRVIVPDLIGFGRSDKPKSIDTHTYAFHVEAMKALIIKLDLRNITLVCQDWGSLIGLRVAAEMPDRFARIVLANGALPTGVDGLPGPAFSAWRASVVRMRAEGDMPVGRAFASKGPEIVAAYAAPFPDSTYKAGPLALPLLVPVTPDDPARAANEKAWSVYRSWTKPFLTAFSDGDPITRGGDKLFQNTVPGAKGQNHTTIVGGGHFLQEDKGEDLAKVVVDFIAANP